jgi:predicted transcriptional regulator
LRARSRNGGEETLRIFWGNPQVEFTSRVECDHVNQQLKPEGISRASIINFLEKMASIGMLNKKENTGKGGYRGVYSSKMDESEFKKFIVERTIEALMRNFPEETRLVISKLS